MNMLARLLVALPKNTAVPAVCAVAAWYTGAKYGAPEILINSIDGMLAQGSDLLGGFVGGAENSGE